MLQVIKFSIFLFGLIYFHFVDSHTFICFYEDDFRFILYVFCLLLLFFSYSKPFKQKKQTYNFMVLTISSKNANP